MKNLSFVLVLFFSCYGFSQNLQVSDSTFLKPHRLDNIRFKPSFGPNNIWLYSNYDLSIYNPTTQLNDNFSVYKNTAEYKNSFILPQNLVYGVKTDSFNPYGVTNMESALGSGALNLLIDLFRTK